MESPTDGSGDPVHDRSMSRAFACLVLAALLVACAAPRPPGEPGVPGPTPTHTPRAAPGVTPAAKFATEIGGLSLVAAFDRSEVAAGGDVVVQLTLVNGRSEPATFEEPCYGNTMTVDLRVPAEPAGRDWDGVAGQFKRYALDHGQGTPIESSTRGPQKTLARDEPCHAEPDVEADPILSAAASIPAGATYTTTLTWSAELVAGVPAEPGEYPFSIRVLYDQQALAGGMIHAETLEVEGPIVVGAGQEGSISPGDAIDVALDDATFAAWLGKQPASSWENANLFLQPGGINTGNAIPAVPYWDVELYRTPRNWGVVLVDALDGTILKTDFCNDPCDR
jgi:hypothetical protein